MTQTSGLVNIAQRFLVKHTPAILTGLGVAGVLGTVVLAVRATPEAIRQIQDAESEQTEALRKRDKIRLVWKDYIPAASVGLLTVGSIIASQGINHRRQAVLMSVYALTETSFREFREKTKEVVGEAKTNKIQDEVAKEHILSAPMVNSEVIITGGGDHLMFDSMSSRYFRGNIEDVRSAVNDINEECLNNMYASQNDFYRRIDLPPAVFGEEVGWAFDHTMRVHFSSHIVEGTNEPALSIEYDVHPIHGYTKVYR